MTRKGRAKRVKSPRTKNKKRFPIGDYKYAMKNVKADYLLECRSLQMEKEKLNAVIVEKRTVGDALETERMKLNSLTSKGEENMQEAT